MFDMSPYLVLIALLPLLASALIAFLGPRLLRQQSHWPCVLAALASCVLSILVLFSVGRHEEGPLKHSYYTWIPADNVIISFALQADGLTAIMLTASRVPLGERYRCRLVSTAASSAASSTTRRRPIFAASHPSNGAAINSAGIA